MNQTAVHPPSMVQAAPLTCLAFSLTKNPTSSPMSLVELNCPDGCFSSTSLLDATSLGMLSRAAMISICFSIRGVNTKPGQIALTVIPFFAFSRATALVNPTIPCLAATQADLLTDATNPWTEAMLMMRPHPDCCMEGSTLLVRQKAELRLSEMTCSHLASGKLTHSSMCCMPALLTNTSTLPKCLMVSATMFLQSAGLVRSAKMNLASALGYFLLKSPTVALISSSDANPLSTTLQPLEAREWAMPSPIPLSEPVTSATLLAFLRTVAVLASLSMDISSY